uniref:Uncharacterized protein n=1 Tax=Tanacetum cinerariifolium TaxID=118510 RepID=A0A699HJR3_TANCI|nr:hypothetical protein [Tanacetum cinerariifolium]
MSSRVLSEKVVGLDVDIMGMALHLDEEFYPCFLTTIAGRRWILSRGLKLMVMKCLQSLEYLATLGGAISCVIDKGMQDRLAADIDHGKAERVLANVAAYNLFAEADFVSAVNALRPAAETPKAEQLQPSLEVSCLEACVADLGVVIFFHFYLLLASRIAACSLISSKRSRLISKASSFYTMSISAILKVGMPIFTRMAAFVLYMSENGVSLFLDLIIVRCAHKTCGTSSIQSLLLSSSCAFIPFPKILFSLSTKPLACGCLTEAKRWRMHNFSHQSLNGLSLNCFPLSDIIHQEFDFARSFRKRSGYVDSLFVEWPRGRDGSQLLLRGPWHEVVNMAIMTFPESSFLHPCTLSASSIDVSL